MKDDRPIIVNESFLKAMHRRMICGWIVAILFLVGACLGQMYSTHNFRESRTEISVLQQQMTVITAEQRKVTESFVLAWENQQATANLLVSWGTYVKERTELSKYNADHRPTEFISARAAK